MNVRIKPSGGIPVITSMDQYTERITMMLAEQREKFCREHAGLLAEGYVPSATISTVMETDTIMQVSQTIRLVHPTSDTDIVVGLPAVVDVYNAKMMVVP